MGLEDTLISKILEGKPDWILVNFCSNLGEEGKTALIELINPLLETKIYLESNDLHVIVDLVQML